MATASCTACGAQLPAKARFCPACGAVHPGASATKLADTEAQQQPSAIPPMRLAPGTRVSVYRIEEIVGEGGMGVVYRARDEAVERAVALKCLHTNLSGDAQIRRRFSREARVLGSWVHPNVVAVYDFVEQEHLLAIVMELVEGKSLVHHLASWRGRMPLAEIRSLFGAVLETMEDGHRRGIVHRDLKPENILVVNAPGGPRPKIVDFGISKILEGTSYTVSGAFLGTCRYISPEQVKAPNSVDMRSDVYSLGVTLYQLVTGRLPFEEENHFALLLAHVSQPPPSPSKLRPEIPAALDRLILDALAKDPAARPQSCASFRERLDAALADVVPASTATTARPLAPVIHDTGGYEMVLVPGGPFLMGRGRRTVHVDSFYVDRAPVTNEQFARFVEVTAYRPTGAGATRFLRTDARRGAHDHAKLPVTYVSWVDASAYAHWVGKRLATEAEWEKAARGTDGRKYPWGRAEPRPSLANFDRKLGGTTPVGSFPAGASPYGALDMAGNVWEWCEDYDDPAFYEDGPTFNPCNKVVSSKLVMRGGAWMFGPQALRTFARTSYAPEYRFAAGGFRCARTA